ncbi:Cthe_2314 family HEPN domain-containing protein [Paenibacillus lutrae]|nr:Cthe_2314 family HEPN domain-containing protein [Paenibacillus lutrae]
MIFDEKRRVDRCDKQLEQAFTSIKHYLNKLQKDRRTEHTYEPKKLHRLYVWTQSFLDALDELEQSQYCAVRFSQHITKSYLDEMNAEELDHYRRYVYFYKNALIRLFSILDKLGYFLNDLFELKTEVIKTHFSFFTVLRRMRETGVHPALQQKLFDLKVGTKQPLEILRNQRNMEIHYVNVDMLDDLMQNHSYFGDRIGVENFRANLAELAKGYGMVCETMDLVFQYISRKAAGEHGEGKHGGNTQDGTHYRKRERSGQNNGSGARGARI